MTDKQKYQLTERFAAYVTEGNPKGQSCFLTTMAAIVCLRSLSDSKKVAYIPQVGDATIRLGHDFAYTYDDKCNNPGDVEGQIIRAHFWVVEVVRRNGEAIPNKILDFSLPDVIEAAIKFYPNENITRKSEPNIIQVVSERIDGKLKCHFMSGDSYEPNNELLDIITPQLLEFQKGLVQAIKSDFVFNRSRIPEPSEN